MDWEKLTTDVVAAATAAFVLLISEKSDEHFYAFALYTDEYAETISPSANSIERYEAKLRDRGGQYPAVYKWGTAEWAYEAWNVELFTGIYRDLEEHRETLPESEAGYAAYRNSVHECMISALKRMDENGFFANGRENITLFISSSDNDEAFDMENQSAKQLNPPQIFTAFLQRYGNDSAGES
jgi:hypothetical protein